MYKVVNCQTGKVYFESPNYNIACGMFFEVEDFLVGENPNFDTTYLNLVNSETGRALSIVYVPDRV